MREMRVEWFEPYRQVLDASRGPEWTQWFTGGAPEHRAQLPGPLGGERSRGLPLGRRERRDAHGHVPRGPRRGQPGGQRTARARPRSRATAWRCACRWCRRSSPSSTAASRRGSPWCRSSRASAPGAIATRLEDSGARVLFTAGLPGAARQAHSAGRQDAAVQRAHHRAAARRPGTISSAASRPNRRRCRSIPKPARSSSTPRAPPASPRARCTLTPDAWRKWARRSGWASTTATTTASSGSPTSAG